MLEEYQKFLMEDLAKKNSFTIEANWEPENDKINKCQILKITFPNKDIAYIDKKYLNTLLFTIGTPDEQRKMIPQKITKVRWYETILSIRAKKDIRKGENITFPIKISLPAIEEEVVSEIKKQYKIPKVEKLPTGILIPKK